MRNSIHRIAAYMLAMASLLLLATGCELFNTPGRAITFEADASLDETKAEYGIDVGSKQRIDWQQGDEVRIVSDWAKTDENNASYWADYEVTPTRVSGSSSFGTISSTNGLCWNAENRESYQFWSVYPINDTDLRFDMSGLTAKLPDARYLMVAYASANYGATSVKLKYYPAFTAFRITLATDSNDVTITDCSLSATSALSGEFSGTITRTGIANVSLGTVSNTASPAITNGSTFTFFCLPIDITGLTVHCYYTKNGVSKEKSLLLKKNGAVYTFAACDQHRISLTLNSQENLEYTLGQLELIRCCFDYTGHNGDNQGTRNKTVDQIRDLLRTNETARAAVANWMATCTKLETFTEIQLDIAREDLQAFPQLSAVSLSLDQNRQVEVDMEDLSRLQSAYIQHGYRIVVKNCDNLSSISLPNTVNNVITTFEFENCPSLTEYNHDANAGRGNFTFTNMSSLKKANFGNSVHNLTFDNCPELEKVTVSNGNGNIESFTLRDTPYFKEATFGNVNGTVAVTLDNCSNSVSSATIKLNNNANATLSRTNSPNVTVTANGNVIN